MKIDPLDEKLKGNRFLSDRGIKQAIYLGLINFFESTNFKLDKVQKTSINMNIKSIFGNNELGNSFPDNIDRNSRIDIDTMKNRTHNTVLLNPQVYCNEFFSGRKIKYLEFIVDCKNNVKKLGVTINHDSEYSRIYDNFNSPKNQQRIYVSNYSYNDIKFNKDDCLAKMFIRINPFADKFSEYSLPIYPQSVNFKPKIKKLLETQIKDSFEIIRSLDMGIEITTDEQIKYLLKEGYLEVKPKLRFDRGFIHIHASDKVIEIKKINEPIVFSEREKYYDELYQHVKLKKKYMIKYNQHVDVKAIETFKLSKFVGIQIHNMPMFRDSFAPDRISYDMKLTDRIERNIEPGYNDELLLQPKHFADWNISKGYRIGYGRLIFYPSGVENS